ncbi:MAG: acetyl-CoA carboxylase biotin carboxyl carrier protein [Thermomicrobiales bacterium]|nr:acetyl-CoA carboxylase biotin carboxyl carrier protein [Thermomicrobiales bacterium]
MAIEQQQANGSTEPAVPDSPLPSGLPEGLTTDVRALIDMMGRGGISDLQLETATVKLRLRARGAAGPDTGVAHPAVAITTSAPGATDTDTDGPLVTAPMIGTFYRAPAPGELDFVDIGDAVEPGQTIGIIEAMKIMNEIVAEVGGVAAEFLVENGQPVEYGQPLLRLTPAPAA